MPDDAQKPPPYLTTREVADLLRVKERKVYDLAAAGEIPHRRITGKLLFPAGEITAWIEGGAEAGGPDLPRVVSGSHDPLLDWAVREAGTGLATLFNGSLDGLEAFAGRRAAVAGLHVPEEDGWNVRTVAARGLRGAVLIAWGVRTRGLVASTRSWPDDVQRPGQSAWPADRDASARRRRGGPVRERCFPRQA